MSDPGRFADVAAQLAAYFDGSAKSFDVRLDLRDGTPFQRDVWAQLQRIPYGERRAYGEIARALGKNGGARAVGGAVGRNLVPIIIPCHRVVRGDGGIGGYAWGLQAKGALLAIETRRVQAEA